MVALEHARDLAPWEGEAQRAAVGAAAPGFLSML
jgi:hypothetical protein